MTMRVTLPPPERDMRETGRVLMLTAAEVVLEARGELRDQRIERQHRELTARLGQLADIELTSDYNMPLAP